MSPYKFDTDKKKLPRELDRRVRLTGQDKEDILTLFKESSFSDIQIANYYGVNRKTIYLLRNPAQAQKEREAYKLRRLDGRYYNKDRHAKSIKSLRLHKKNNEDKLI